MKIFEKLTQEQLKLILLDVQQKGEAQKFKDVNAMIHELKRQIFTSINRWEIDQYEESI